MASNYPGSLDSFDTIASDKKMSDSVGGRTHRQILNDLGDAIESVQTELGTNPSGGAATVKARFEAIEANDWVTAARIAANAVGSSELADASVTAAKIVIGTTTIGYGTAAPEGSVTAPIGSSYLQTSGAATVSGQLLWRKTSGTGSTGWTPEGALADTGTRDISSATMLNGWVVGFGQHFIRRVGDVVDYYALILNTDATADAFYTIPSGFRPLIAARPICSTTNSTTFNKVEITSAGSAEVKAYNTRPTGTYTYVSVTWTTRDAWPTSLPGTAN